MKQVLIFLFSLSIFGSHAMAKPTATSREGVLKKYSLDELDSAANLLKVAIDQGQDKKNAHFCNLKAGEAKNLTMPLKDLIDVKTKIFLDANKGKSVSLGFKNQDCDGECHCGLYSSVLDTGQQRGDTLTDNDLKYLSMAQTKASTQGSYQSVACAYRSKWVCSSALLKYLRGHATK